MKLLSLSQNAGANDCNVVFGPADAHSDNGLPITFKPKSISVPEPNNLYGSLCVFVAFDGDM